jgi:hypothetical protein
MPELGGDDEEATAALSSARLGDDDEDAPTLAGAPVKSPREAKTRAERANKPLTATADVDFVPDDADVPQGKRLAPKLPPPSERARKTNAPVTPMDELLRLAKRQPVWVWGVLGGGVALLIVLIIAIAR